MSNQNSGGGVTFIAVLGFLVATYGVFTDSIGLWADAIGLGWIDVSSENEAEDGEQTLATPRPRRNSPSSSSNQENSSSEADDNDDPCSNNGLPPRLNIGDYGIVMAYPDQANFVRAGAGTDYTVLDRIEVGRDFEVLDGPRCANNIYWWRVRSYDGTIGWTAEGNDGYYYVEPLD